jgi:lysophospholipase L1-like esterase
MRRVLSPLLGVLSTFSALALLGDAGPTNVAAVDKEPAVLQLTNRSEEVFAQVWRGGANLMEHWRKARGATTVSGQDYEFHWELTPPQPAPAVLVGVPPFGPLIQATGPAAPEEFNYAVDAYHQWRSDFTAGAETGSASGAVSVAASVNTNVILTETELLYAGTVSIQGQASADCEYEGALSQSVCESGLFHLKGETSSSASLAVELVSDEPEGTIKIWADCAIAFAVGVSYSEVQPDGTLVLRGVSLYSSMPSACGGEVEVPVFVPSTPTTGRFTYGFTARAILTPNDGRVIATSASQPFPPGHPFAGHDTIGTVGSFSARLITADTTNFDWTVPDRFGSDRNEDGLIDHFVPGGTLEIEPKKGWRVDFEHGDPSTCDTLRFRTWYIDGEEIASGDPRALELDPHSCEFSYSFEEEGTYHVRLEVADEEGDVRGQAEHEVIVQDWLIISLGDSVASGEGNPKIEGPISPLWENEQCHRTELAGPAQAALNLEQADKKTSVTFIHLACSGATIDEGLIGSYRGVEPGRPLPPQVKEMLRYVGEREIDAVLISIGANDITFSSVLKFCLNPFDCTCTPVRCLNLAEELFNVLLRWAPERYSNLANAIASSGRVPAERVFITEYFDPSRDDGGDFCEIVDPRYRVPLMSKGEFQWASEGMLPRVNREVQRAAERHGWNFLGGITRQFLNHGYCADDRWVRQILESLVVQGDQFGAFHPNVAGHAIYRDAIKHGLEGAFYLDRDIERPRPPED